MLALITKLIPGMFKFTPQLFAFTTMSSPRDSVAESAEAKGEREDFKEGAKETLCLRNRQTTGREVDQKKNKRPSSARRSNGGEALLQYKLGKKDWLLNLWKKEKPGYNISDTC